MKILDKILHTAAGKLRFPWLLAITATLFVANLFIPDAIPFVDEILLGLATLVIARIREPKEENSEEDRALPEREESGGEK